MKKYNFTKGQWENDFEYAYSLVAKSYTQFEQKEDCVVNTYNNEIGDYNYVSIVHREKQSGDIKVSAKCSFDKFGAPLITFANSLEMDGEGRIIYGEHYEVVLYENGCNIWHIVKAPEGYFKKYVNTKTDFKEFKIGDGEEINVLVALSGKKISVLTNGVEFATELPLLNDEFYVGFTACEGINRFYSAALE